MENSVSYSNWLRNRRLALLYVNNHVVLHYIVFIIFFLIAHLSVVLGWIELYFLQKVIFWVHAVMQSLPKRCINWWLDAAIAMMPDPMIYLFPSFLCLLLKQWTVVVSYNPLLHKPCHICFRHTRGYCTL